MDTNADVRDIDAELRRFNDEMVRLNLTPTWAYYTELVSKMPVPSYRAYLWKADLLEYVMSRAAKLVDLARGGERRSFEVVNPDLRHLHGTTHTIGAALQLVQPGEIAPSHRHLASAIRFPVKGKAYTAVNGEKLYMEERDLILTPTWTWHEHGNENDEPILWIDALDYPFNKLMQVSFFDHYPGGMHPNTKPLDHTASWVGLARPTWERYDEDIPLVNYKWAHTYATLDRFRDREGSPYDGILIEYKSPFRDGPVLPTMSCYAQMLRPNEHTRAHRQTSSHVYYVLEGSGHSVIAGERFDWSQGDFFMIPPWAWHEHANGGNGEALFFSIGDRPILDAFQLYREEAYEENGYRQRIERTFQPIAPPRA
jgi:gentisate 1,2-dioxygenase